MTSENDLRDSGDCRNCAGTSWVCENHADHVWDGMCCGGAGMPCGACNLSMASTGHVHAERERCAAIAMNPGFIEGQDNEWDEGVNFAKRFIAKAIMA